MRICADCVSCVNDSATLRCELVRDLIHGKLMECEKARFDGMGIVSDSIKSKTIEGIGYLECNPIGIHWKQKQTEPD